MMTTTKLYWGIWLLFLCGHCPLCLIAQDEIRLSAQRLVNATVTLRATESRDFLGAAEGGDEGDGAAPAPRDNEITVCSGTYVGENRLLSFGCLPVIRNDGTVETEYRVTLPAGRQATARPRVVDHHSGLVLLGLDGDAADDLTPLELAEILPETGGEVLTAAAAGVEEPLVSLGVLSGVDRFLPGTELPPLLVCDISTTGSSSGAAVVDRQARLIGIVAAASLPGENFGWSYAIPLKHIRRVLDAEQVDRVVVLARMRPSLGVVLGPGRQVGSVVVQHVVEGGPGEQAGLQVGDHILAIEGRQVRSVYQAGAILRKHLPGERIGLLCVSPVAAEPLVGEAQSGSSNAAPVPSATARVAGSRQRRVEVTLGAQSDESNALLPAEVQAQTIKARFTAPSNIELSNAARSYQLSLGTPSGTATATGSGKSARALDVRGGAIAPPEGTGLRNRLQEYEQLIHALREESDRQREQLAKREQMIQALQEQLVRLRQEVAGSQETREADE